MSDTVNTGFILDMQRKLYRWSAADPDKRFADLFNVVCDRGTLLHAWQRLARNRGSNTPGTDGVTRKAVEERPDGVPGFLEDIREELRRGTYQAEPVRQRLIPKPGKPGRFRPLGHPHAQRPTGPNRAQAGARADLRGGLLSDLVRLPARPKRRVSRSRSSPASPSWSVPRTS